MISRMLFGIAAVLVLCSSHAQQPALEAPAQIREIVERRFTAYSADFAGRFKLPPAGIAPELNSGLEAIEIGFEPGHEPGWFRCYTALYLRSSVGVDVGELGAEVSWDPLEDVRHFFLRKRPDGAIPRQLMAMEDAVHLGKRQARYYQRIAFGTKDHMPGRSGAQASELSQEHVAELFPGIRYLRARGCMSSRMIAHGKGVNVVIRRQGAPDYSQIVGPFVRADHFVWLPLPDKLLEEAMPSLKAIEEYMMRAIDDYNRARRPK